MKSRAVGKFWELYNKLSPDVQRKADRAYRLWRANPSARGLHFKRVSENDPIYSVRIGLEYRAVGLLEADTVYWFFIGRHDEYDRELRGR